MSQYFTRFAGPFLLSVASLALVAPGAALAQAKDSPAAKTAARTAKADSAKLLSPGAAQDRRGSRDGRPKDGPRDTGIKRGLDRPVSP